MMEEIEYMELHNRHDWLKAVVVFTEDSFSEKYSEKERSYEFDCFQRAFQPGIISSAVNGTSLDGREHCVRIDIFIDNGWKIERCYISAYKEGENHG